jgi:pimeloyl-ACP methyl ester carboxylesterase
VRSHLARDFRLITYDLRGHGNSDKPTAAEHYEEDKRWGDDLHAVLTQMNVRRPVLVGPSFAAMVINQYLIHHGSDRIAGVNYVAAYTKADDDLDGPGVPVLGPMCEDDLEKNIEHTKKFIAHLTTHPLPRDEHETLLAALMLCPYTIRARMWRPVDYEQLFRSLQLPVLVTHGEADQFLQVGMARYTASMIAGAKLSVYEGLGHAPYLEDPERFNRELSDFARAAHGR